LNSETAVIFLPKRFEYLIFVTESKKDQLFQSPHQIKFSKQNNWSCPSPFLAISDPQTKPRPGPFSTLIISTPLHVNPIIRPEITLTFPS
jgi:hypothetical protein